MLTDRLGLFTDNKAVTSSMDSESIHVTKFRGRGEPVHITVLVTEPYNDGASVTVQVQESDDDSAFATVGSFAFKDLTGLDPKLSLDIPPETTGTYIRLHYEVVGATRGKLWAGVTREELGWYRRGLYIQKGKVVL